MNAPLLYWFPKHLDVPAEHRHLFNRAGRWRCSMARNSQGPGEGRGCLAAPFDSVISVYSERIQRWDQIGPGIWVGADKNATPQQLLRPDHRGGRWVKMADGHEWLIPVANPFVDSCTLPFWHRLSAQRRWERCLQDHYVSLGQRAADIAAELRAAVLEQRDATADDDEARRLIADAIAVNYDVTIEELSVLRVFAPENTIAALYAVVDWHEMLRLMTEALQEARAGDSVAAPFGGGSQLGTRSTGNGELE